MSILPATKKSLFKQIDKLEDHIAVQNTALRRLLKREKTFTTAILSLIRTNQVDLRDENGDLVASEAALGAFCERYASEN